MQKLVVLLLILSGLEGVAQQDFTLYNMQEVPQSTYANPSNRFNGSFYIGLPGISSNYLSLTNSRFAYSDVIIKQGNSLNLSFQEIIDESADDNYLSLNTKIDLLSFGFSLSEKTQFTFHITENANLRLNYTDDFIRFVYNGNAGFSDSVANFEGIGINAMHYREYGVGISHQLNEKLRIGGKAKFLYGMENIYSERTDINLFTDPETFQLQAEADISLKTSGIDDVDDDESTADYLSGRKNTGFAIDLGANYQVSEKLSVNASILDLGWIRWKSFTKNFNNPGSNFTYNGIEINAFTGETEDAPEDEGTSLDRVLDSLEAALDLDTTRGAYTTSLSSRFFIGANYQLNDKTIVGGIIHSEFFQNRIHPSFTANFNRKLNKWIGVSASYTVFNQSFTNLGLGLNLNPGPIQFYLTADNVLGAFKPQDARLFQLRFGINLLFGGERTTDLNPAFHKKEKRAKKNKKEKKNSKKEETENSKS